MGQQFQHKIVGSIDGFEFEEIEPMNDPIKPSHYHKNEIDVHGYLQKHFPKEGTYTVGGGKKVNLAKLFEQQKNLRDRIGYNEPDRFEKLILALLVEIGECANEWRGFKFWSKNQEPKTFEWFGVCNECNGHGVDDENYSCPACAGTGDGHKNPLLEEYVDGLHFVLELGLEVEFKLVIGEIEIEKFGSVLEQFNILYDAIIKFKNKRYFYLELLSRYLALGEMLGFTPEQIEQAYFDKNAVNHQRQEQGY